MSAITRKFYLPITILILFLLAVVSITIWSGNTFTAVTVITRFERTHTVSRVEAVTALFDYNLDHKPEDLKIFYEKMAVTQSYNKVFSQLIELRKNKSNKEFIKIIETTFSETDHNTASIIANRLKIFSWHPTLRALVASATNANLMGELLIQQANQFIKVIDDEAKHAVIFENIHKIRADSIIYETDFSKNCSKLAEQISLYVTYTTIILLAFSIGFISLLVYKIAKTIIQQTAKDTLALSEMTKRFKLAQKAGGVGIWDWDLIKDNIIWDEQMYHLYGISANQFNGAYTAWKNGLHPEDLERGDSETKAAIAGEKDFNTEFRVIWPDGSVHFIRGIGFVQRDSTGKPIRMIGTNWDITERKHSDDNLARIANQLPGMIYQFKQTPDGKISMPYASAWIKKIYGITPEDVKDDASMIFSKHHPEDQEGIKISIEKSAETLTPWRHTYRIFNPQGEIRWIYGDSMPYKEPDGSIIWYGFITDITDKKESEREQSELFLQLQHAQKMESLGTLASGVAHDMNNVLAAILGMAEIGATHVQDQHLFDVIVKAAKRGSQMVKSLLTLARTNTAEMESFDINTLVREVVTLLERTTLAKIKLVTELASEPLFIYGDSNAIMHALTNICVNATDAMPEGGTLTIKSGIYSEWIVLNIIDTGTGMSPDVLEKALDPFFTTKPHGKGTGLGLSMVYSTMQAHKGVLEIKSTLEVGTVITLKFLSTKTIEEAPKYAEVRVASIKSLNILVVDDDELLRESISALLESLGHKISTAETGEESIAYLENHFLPDVIVMDMNMPGQGGAVTTEIIQKTYPDIPILLATGRVDDRVISLTSHKNVYLLAKPFDLTLFKSLLRKIAYEGTT